jgi:hypothetical protein
MRMNINPNPFCYLFLVLTLAATGEAKEWRDIVPLRSTRKDVDRLLGAPTRQTPSDAHYDVKDGGVFVTFSEGDCNKWPTGYDVPAGTVESLYFYPVKDVPLSELKLDKGRFREFLDVHYRILHFIDDAAGFSIVALEHDKKVREFVYYPPAKEEHLQCYQNIKGVPKGRPRAGQDSLFSYFEYSSTGEENKRLDAFAQALLRDANTEGYIIGYAGQRAYRGESKERAERAKKYVVDKYGIRSERVWAVDGGHNKYRSAELYIEPLGGPVPPPDPDIRPSSVQIIDEKRVQQSPRSRP